MATTANKVRAFPLRHFRQTPLAGALSICASLTFIQDAQAVDWRITPQIRGAVTYTDNINQSENSEGALILSVTPAFQLVSEGSRRIQANVNYGLTGVTRIGRDTSNDVYHNLGAVGKAELVEDLLFIDGTASVSQELISLFGSPADARTNDSNRATVGIYSLSPYMVKRLGTFATAEARYTNRGAIFDNNSGSNLNSNELLASLNSGTRYTDWNWGIRYSNRQVSSNDVPDATFESLTGTAGFALTRKIRLLGIYGIEDNEYVGATNTSGSRYEVGIAWSPSRRTSVQATVGERYFGRTYSFAARHATRTTSWRVSYSENFSDISRLGIDRQNIIVTCANGTVLPANTTVEQAVATPGCEAGSVIFGTSLQTGIFLAKLFTANMSWTAGRFNLGVAVSDLRRIYQQTVRREDRTKFVTGTLNYRLSRLTNANAGISIGRVQTNALLGAPNREDTLYGLNLGLTHQFGKDLTGALIFRHQERSSSAVNSDYTGNSLTASATLRF